MRDLVSGPASSVRRACVPGLPASQPAPSPPHNAYCDAPSDWFTLDVPTSDSPISNLKHIDYRDSQNTRQVDPEVLCCVENVKNFIGMSDHKDSFPVQNSAYHDRSESALFRSNHLSQSNHMWHSESHSQSQRATFRSNVQPPRNTSLWRHRTSVPSSQSHDGAVWRGASPSSIPTQHQQVFTQSSNYPQEVFGSNPQSYSESLPNPEMFAASSRSSESSERDLHPLNNLLLFGDVQKRFYSNQSQTFQSLLSPSNLKELDARRKESPIHKSANDSDTDIDFIEAVPVTREPEIITLNDDSVYEVDAQSSAEDGELSPKLTPPPAPVPSLNCAYSKESTTLKEKLSQSKFLIEVKKNSNETGKSLSSLERKNRSKKVKRRKRSTSQDDFHLRKKRNSSGLSRKRKRSKLDSSLQLVQSLEKMPHPGTLAELLLKNHPKHFVEKVIVKPSTKGCLSTSNTDSDDDCMTSAEREEEELLLRKIALESVVHSLDKDGVKKSKILTSTLENRTVGDQHASQNSEETTLVMSDTNENPVDMDICDSDAEEESNLEARNEKENFSFPVELAYMMPPPAAAHQTNDLNSFKNFSYEQNLCKQAMELSVQGYNFEAYRALGATTQGIISDENYPYSSAVFTSGWSEKLASSFSGQEGTEPALVSSQTSVDADDISKSMPANYAHMLSLANARNREVFMDAVTKPTKSNTSNLIHIKLDKNKIPMNVQRKRSRRSKKGALLPRPLRDAKHDASSSTTVAHKLPSGSEEDEILLRNQLLHAMLIKQPLFDESARTIPARDLAHDAPIMSCEDQIDQSQATILNAEANSKPDFSLRNNVVETKNVFKYPKPIIINLDSESDSDSSDSTMTAVTGGRLRRSGISSPNFSEERAEFSQESSNRGQERAQTTANASIPVSPDNLYPEAIQHLSRSSQVEYRRMKLRLQEIAKAKKLKLSRQLRTKVKLNEQGPSSTASDASIDGIQADTANCRGASADPPVLANEELQPELVNTVPLQTSETMDMRVGESRSDASHSVRPRVTYDDLFKDTDIDERQSFQPGYSQIPTCNVAAVETESEEDLRNILLANRARNGHQKQLDEHYFSEDLRLVIGKGPTYNFGPTAVSNQTESYGTSLYSDDDAMQSIADKVTNYLKEVRNSTNNLNNLCPAENEIAANYSSASESSSRNSDSSDTDSTHASDSSSADSDSEKEQENAVADENSTGSLQLACEPPQAPQFLPDGSFSTSSLESREGVPSNCHLHPLPNTCSDEQGLTENPQKTENNLFNLIFDPIKSVEVQDKSCDECDEAAITHVLKLPTTSPEPKPDHNRSLLETSAQFSKPVISEPEIVLSCTAINENKTSNGEFNQICTTNAGFKQSIIHIETSKSQPDGNESHNKEVPNSDAEQTMCIKSATTNDGEEVPNHIGCDVAIENVSCVEMVHSEQCVPDTIKPILTSNSFESTKVNFEDATAAGNAQHAPFAVESDTTSIPLKAGVDGPRPLPATAPTEVAPKGGSPGCGCSAVEEERRVGRLKTLGNYEQLISKRSCNLESLEAEVRQQAAAVSSVDQERQALRRSLDALRAQLATAESHYRAKSSQHYRACQRLTSLKTRAAADTLTLQRLRHTAQQLGKEIWGSDYRLGAGSGSEASSGSPAIKRLASGVAGGVAGGPSKRHKTWTRSADGHSNVTSISAKSTISVGSSKANVLRTTGVRVDKSKMMPVKPRVRSSNFKLDNRPCANPQRSPASNDTHTVLAPISSAKEAAPKLQLLNESELRNRLLVKMKQNATRKTAPLAQCDDSDSVCPYDLLGTCNDENCSLRHLSPSENNKIQGNVALLSCSKGIIVRSEKEIAEGLKSDESMLKETIYPNSACVENAHDNESNKQIEFVSSSRENPVEAVPSALTNDESDDSSLDSDSSSSDSESESETSSDSDSEASSVVAVGGTLAHSGEGEDPPSKVLGGDSEEDRVDFETTLIVSKKNDGDASSSAAGVCCSPQGSADEVGGDDMSACKKTSYKTENINSDVVGRIINATKVKKYIISSECTDYESVAISQEHLSQSLEHLASCPVQQVSSAEVRRNLASQQVSSARCAKQKKCCGAGSLAAGDMSSQVDDEDEAISACGKIAAHENCSGVDEMVSGGVGKESGVVGEESGGVGEESGVDEVASDVDEQACGVDEQACGVDEQACGVDEQACGVDEQACGVDEQASDADEVMDDARA
ncbi:uncharacterized protein LOC108676273 [Hyalella azteca]|uniref:Uncharacterized protein LOC108676273 n=1 Tax=Hyalella azteca TaxID=294128 RepID=A0A8B7P148_HYAAZ|nr:uncharacterized protein LOC108676273 [Hyalella azteca]